MTRSAGQGVRDFNGIHRRVHKLELPLSVYQDDENGSRTSEKVWQPRLGLTRPQGVPKKAASIEHVIGWICSDGRQRFMTGEADGQVQGFIQPEPGFGGVSTFTIEDFEAAANWTLLVAPKLAIVTLNDDLDNQEGTFAMRVNIAGIWGPFQPVAVGRGGPATIVPPVDISLHTNLRLWSKATMAGALLEIGLGDSVGTPQEWHPTQLPIGAAYAEYDWPLASFGAVNLALVDKLYLRMEGNAIGDFFFDDLRAIP